MKTTTPITMLFFTAFSLFLVSFTVALAAEQNPEDPAADPAAIRQDVKIVTDDDIPAPVQCDLDITANLPADVNWKNVHMLKAPDGTVWQRTIMVRPEGTVTLKEGEALIFEGTGQEFSNNKVFIFNNAEDENGNIPIPDQGTCWEVPEKADNEGRFKFAIAANTYWDALGEEMIIDSFTQLEDSWDQYVDEETNQNFFIGTRMEPKVITLVGEPDTTEGCTYLCDENPVEEGAAHDILLKSVILDPTTLEGKEYLLRNNFDVLPGERIAIARYMHNFYGGTADDVTDQKAYTTDLAMKSMSMELIKQMMLGKIDKSLHPVPKTPIKSITATSMRNAASGTTTYSQEIKDIAGYIKTMMTSLVEEGDRTTAATDLAALVSEITQQCDPNAADDTIDGDGYLAAEFNGCISVDNITLRQIFPPEPTDGRTGSNDWANDFITLMEFWTDSLSANACILPAETKAADWNADVRRYFYANGHNHSSHRRECGWDLTYSFGFAS